MGLQNRIIPKRSLGQNFFANEELIDKISRVVLESNPEHITEIGPGKGAFTKRFYVATVPLALIEKDIQLSRIITNKFPDAEVHNTDFIDYKLENPDTTYFGSLPFNVAEDIISKIIKSYTFTNPAFFIVQKEVAEKYANKEIGTLGLITKIYADCKILFNIKAGNFKPRPRVDASLIRLVPHGKYQSIDKEALEILIKRSFKQPRKTLYNNLKGFDYKLPENLKSKRAHEIKLDAYISILERN